MRKQDYLVQLIHSLTPSEKKYFRQYMEGSTAPRNYEKLFDLLQKVDHYDADDLSSRLKTSKKNLADDKEYLQEILLKSLNNFHAPASHRAYVFNGLLEADVLAGKGLVQFALAHIRKLKKGIISSEENLLYYHALVQEINLITAITPGGLKADEWVKASQGEAAKRLEAAALNNKLITICQRILDLSADIKYIESKAVQKEAKALVEEAHALVKGKKLPSLTYQSYHQLLAQYYFFMGVDTRLSVMHARKALERYESETEDHRHFHIINYYNYYAQMLQGYFELRKYKEVEYCIEKLREFTKQKISRRILIRAEKRIFIFSLLFLTSTRQHEKALKFINSNLPAIRKIPAMPEDLSLVQLLKAVNFFHMQRYDEALSELLPLMASNPPAQLPETRISARALNLMIQYELGNRISMPSYMIAAKRFFTNEGLMTKEVKLFLELMRYLHKHEKKVPVDEFQKRFEEVYNAHRFEIIGYFVIWPWLMRFPKRKI